MMVKLHMLFDLHIFSNKL